MTKHGFCKIHRIAYNRDLDPTCPQCMIAHIVPGEQLDFDEFQQKPLDSAGRPLDKRSLEPVD